MPKLGQRAGLTHSMFNGYPAECDWRYNERELNLLHDRCSQGEYRNEIFVRVNGFDDSVAFPFIIHIPLLNIKNMI